MIKKINIIWASVLLLILIFPLISSFGISEYCDEGDNFCINTKEKSELIIEVDYDEWNNEIENRLTIYIYDFNKNMVDVNEIKIFSSNSWLAYANVYRVNTGKYEAEIKLKENEEKITKLNIEVIKDGKSSYLDIEVEKTKKESNNIIKEFGFINFIIMFSFLVLLIFILIKVNKM